MGASRDSLGAIDTLDVLILCGGAGTRLRSVVPDRPKGLAPVWGRPFLDIVVEELLRYGIRRITFCIGHLKEQIVEHYSGRTDADYRFSVESSPLGTGGAVQNALSFVQNESFLVMNGDSLCWADLQAFVDFHRAKHATASLVLSPAARDDAGRVTVDRDGRIQRFAEKAPETCGEKSFVNAGIYLLQKNSFAPRYEQRMWSLEHDFFPALVKAAPCFGFIVGGPLIDIGTPERYWNANERGPAGIGQGNKDSSS